VEVRTTLLAPTQCTVPACRAEMYIDPGVALAGAQMAWRMQPLEDAVGFAITFTVTVGRGTRVVALLVSDFPARVEERTGVCVWSVVS